MGDGGRGQGWSCLDGHEAKGSEAPLEGPGTHVVSVRDELIANKRVSVQKHAAERRRLEAGEGQSEGRRRGWRGGGAASSSTRAGHWADTSLPPGRDPLWPAATPDSLTSPLDTERSQRPSTKSSRLARPLLLIQRPRPASPPLRLRPRAPNPPPRLLTRAPYPAWRRPWASSRQPHTTRSCSKRSSSSSRPPCRTLAAEDRRRPTRPSSKGSTSETTRPSAPSRFSST